jgi:hypothetical protein
VRADKQAAPWSGLRDRLSTKRGDALREDILPSDVPDIEESVVKSPWGAEHYPALDLMANWTNDQPSMSQMMDGLSEQAVIDANRQSGDVVN